MIIRKPYAFLIRHFKKIHIFLLLFCIFILSKASKTYGFIKEFMEFRSYNEFIEPISKYASSPTIFLSLVVIVISIMLLFLLKHKNKPWKLYLLPVIEYTAMLFILLWTRSFFNNYDGTQSAADIRMIRDILLIVQVLQYPTIVLYLIRIFGVDLHKFNFKMDEEYLEMDSEDREELEINISIDKHMFIRAGRRLIRNLGYVYQEHKLVCNTIAVIIGVILLKNAYTFIFITNKSYKEGQNLDANGYSIVINNSYYTNKRFNGDVISSKNNFVIIDLTVKNNWSSRELNLNNFHLQNATNNYSQISKLYAHDFADLGKTYDSVKTLKRDESIDLILIYRVDKKLPKNRFALYYQELDKDPPYLRKIKLKIEDISEIKKQKALSMGDTLKFEVDGKKEEIIFDDIEIKDTVEFTTRKCNTTVCSNQKEKLTAKKGNKILYLSFASIDYEGKQMIDFSTSYGKISYVNSKGKEKIIDIKSAVNKTYYGKYLYITLPDDAASSKDINLIYTVRNKKYIYKLNEGE